jgi:hypothetical protein
MTQNYCDVVNHLFNIVPWELSCWQWPGRAFNLTTDVGSSLAVVWHPNLVTRILWSARTEENWWYWGSQMSWYWSYCTSLYVLKNVSSNRNKWVSVNVTPLSIQIVTATTDLYPLPYMSHPWVSSSTGNPQILEILAIAIASSVWDDSSNYDGAPVAIIWELHKHAFSYFRCCRQGRFISLERRSNSPSNRWPSLSTKIPETAKRTQIKPSELNIMFFELGMLIWIGIVRLNFSEIWYVLIG